MIKELASFYKRRIFIPVNKNSLVLDVGSGDKPHWRSDVLLDKYIDDEYGSQRSGNKKTKITKPIFNADAIDMPFADKDFDFVICSHLLEHVVNPSKVIEEIMRVGKAGYIELPYEGMQKILDFSSHLWYCRKDGEKLIFTAKTNVVFDKEIDKFIKSQKIKWDNDKCIISLNWNNAISYQIIGEPNLEILSIKEKINYKKIIFFVRNLLNYMFSILFIYKKSKNTVMTNSILKHKFYFPDNKPLEKKIYKF